MHEDYQEALDRIQEAKHDGLAELNLSNLQLTQFPFEILELRNLIKLELNGNQLIKIPKNIGQLTNLTHFNLSSNQLSTFPEAIGQLTNLTHLDLSSNQLPILSTDVGRLTNLTHLDLAKNKLTALPEAVGGLTKLTYLNLSLNKFFIVPSHVERLKNLEELYLDGNDLFALPEFIGKLTKLITLHAGHNRLTTLIDDIINLESLNTLFLANNELVTLPETIGELPNLSSLNLKKNQLATLPVSIANLTNLSILVLIENQFQVGAEIYELLPQQQIHEILKWQAAQLAGTLQPLHEAKVIFIGESNFGKTHLIELLRDGAIKRKIITTHGIERSHIPIPYKTKDIRLNIWDLGGQEFMRSTHQFFFSERTLYVLVTLARRERNELNHWLKLADQLGNKAPVLVVINKIDLDPHDLDRRSLQRDYPNIVDFVRTTINDCKEGKASDSLKFLKDKIIEIVSDKDLMPGVFEQRPPDWFTVKEELEKLEATGTDFITYEEYKNLKFIKSLPEQDRKSNLKLLSMIGAVVSFVDDPRLIDTNVINPQWIMDGVYAIINDPIVKDKTKGRLEKTTALTPKKNLGRPILPF